VAHTLNIDLELVSVKPSNNLTAPNGMVSGGSLTSEACAYVSVEMCSNLVCSLHLLLSQQKLIPNIEVLVYMVVFFYSADSVLTLTYLLTYSMEQSPS
jgi:hypothetical protein